MKRVRNQRPTVYEYDQPFDLFEDFNKGQKPQYTGAPRRISWTLDKGRVLLMAGAFLLTVIGGFVGLAIINKPQAKNPFVLLEMRAISKTGHPVAGAEVMIEGKGFGVTDSFGEWRRYLRLSPGRFIEVKIKKEVNGRPYLSKKRFQVPNVGQNGVDPELKMTLELRGQRQLGQKVSTNRSNAEARKASLAEIPAEEQVALAEPMLDSGEIEAITVSYQNFYSKTGSQMEVHQSSMLGDKIVPEIRAVAAEKGLRVGEAGGLRLRIQYLPQPGRIGFVKAEVRWDQAGRTERRSFIRSFSKTISQTADDILRQAKLYVNRPYNVYKRSGKWFLGQDELGEFWRFRHGAKVLSDAGELYRTRSVDGRIEILSRNPCGRRVRQCQVRRTSIKEEAPRASWSSQRLVVKGKLPDDAQLFIDGYPAFRRGGGWDFWGENGEGQYLSIVSGDQIFYRTRIIPSKDRTLSIQVPQSYARR